jgi:dynein intermediate chain 1
MSNSRMFFISRRPLFTFDVHAQAGDIAWAPYSSTTFAAVTTDGKVHIFDMSMDRYKAVCVQAVVPRRRAQLNHISFNPTHPIIIVGDSRGHIQSLKLSPNLRKESREVRQALLNKDHKRAGELEIKKFDDILSQVRDQHSLNIDHLE